MHVGLRPDEKSAFYEVVRRYFSGVVDKSTTVRANCLRDFTYQKSLESTAA